MAGRIICVVFALWIFTSVAGVSPAYSQRFDLRGTDAVNRYLESNLVYYPGAVRVSNRNLGTCQTTASGWPMSFDFKQIPWWMRYEDFQREFVHELRSCGAQVHVDANRTGMLNARVIAVGLQTPQGEVFDVEFTFRPQLRLGPGNSGTATDGSISIPHRCGSNRIHGCAITNHMPNFGLDRVSIQGRPAVIFGEEIGRAAGPPLQAIGTWEDFVVVPGGVAPRSTTRAIGRPFYNLRTAEAEIPFSDRARPRGSFAANSDVPTLLIRRRPAGFLPPDVVIPSTVYANQ